jgi:hypothetical protein
MLIVSHLPGNFLPKKSYCPNFLWNIMPIFYWHASGYFNKSLQNVDK